LHSPSPGARAFIPLVLAGVALIGLAPGSPVAAAGPKTEAQQIIKIAKHQLGDPWRYAATGPAAFDCSGLVIYAFRAAGDKAAVANGRLRSARALYKWYKARGLASRTNPKPGDLVVWGGGSHIGIYIGNGKAISTLTSGVRIHGVHAVTASFTAYLHTGMSRAKGSGSSVAPKPAVAAPAPAWTKVARTNVNIRSGASLGSARLGVLPRGRRVIVSGSARDAHGRVWLHVRTAGRTGWVASWLVR
jgi:hypothetical protein